MGTHVFLDCDEMVPSRTTDSLGLIATTGTSHSD
ncbi:hypothetical protein FHS27_003936 [Rhodopirellula rubra]|uniref:Uncharacterized protein n=1 Tax=Aporhodopirellula rubra TaxID=980271 RepID=A0A7W5E0S2_9BACT|nr:hypothetical protein [Aporhodopirellula rubra]